MSGTHGPIEISPLPADGGVVKSSLTHDTGIGWRYGLHMGNNSGFSIG